MNAVHFHLHNQKIAYFKSSIEQAHCKINLWIDQIYIFLKTPSRGHAQG